MLTRLYLRWAMKRHPLTDEQIKEVRTKIHNLYLGKEFLSHKLSKALIFMRGSTPVFECRKADFYLKVSSEGVPYWDMQSHKNAKVRVVEFTHRVATQPRLAVFALHKKFPYKPTNNFLVYDEVGH